MKSEMSEESELDTSFSTGSERSPLASPTTHDSKCLTVVVADHSGLKLKFSIDNILRPDFGLKGSPGSKCSSGSPTPTTPLSSPAVPVTPGPNNLLWPAWVYCTRYSDRPSSGPRKRKNQGKADSDLNSDDQDGPRCRKLKKKPKTDDKRPRTAFTGDQLSRLKHAFQENRYLTEKRRQELSQDLGLNESQIKIWFQNKRAKIKKSNGGRHPLALHLMAQGLYNHSSSATSTVSCSSPDSEMGCDEGL